MRSGRLAALIVLGGLLAAGLLVEAGEDPAPPVELDRVVPGVAMPATRAETLTSTWFCAGGTATPDGIADHVIVIANPTDQAREATLTVLTGRMAAPPAAGEGADDEGQAAEGDQAEQTEETTTTTAAAAPPTNEAPATHVVEVPALDRVEVALADIVEAPLAGAVVEIDGGGVAVEHQVTGDGGRATAPCSTTTSDRWVFPWGVTTRGNRELLVLMNPFPDDATVDATFATDQGTREPARLQGLVVPRRSMVGVFVDEDMRREQVSALIDVRGGRIVVDRIQVFDGTDGREGITLAHGAPVPAEVWTFPTGETADGLEEQVVVLNPSDEVAEVEVEVLVDGLDPEEDIPPEPFSLTVPQGRYSLVNLHAEERIPTGTKGHAIVVRSLNGVPIAAERVNAAGEPATNRGITATLGSPFEATRWIFAAGGPDAAARDQLLVLQNPSADTVTYDVTGFSGGQTIALQNLQGREIAPGGRAVIRLGDHIDRERLSVVVEASAPIVAERGLYAIGGRGMAISMGIPFADGVVVPDPLEG